MGGSIMDNLIADGKASPFIIVMANSYVPGVNVPGRGPGPAGQSAAASSPGATASAGATSTRPPGSVTGPGGRSFDFNAFAQVLAEDLIPIIDANFRTMADQPHRAMAGLAMGGAETKIITLKNLDNFSHIGLFSGGTITTNDVNNTAGFREKVKVVFASCGGKENPGSIPSNHQALNSMSLKKPAYVSPETAHDGVGWFVELGGLFGV